MIFIFQFPQNFIYSKNNSITCRVIFSKTKLIFINYIVRTYEAMYSFEINFS